MRLAKFGIWFLLVTLIFSTVTSAFSAPVRSDRFRVMLQNRTGERVTIRLSGPENITYELPKKSKTVELLAGDYYYSYVACNRTFTGILKVKRNNTLLTLWPCTPSKTDVGTKTVTLLIVNTVDAPLRFVFTGPQTYRFTVLPGKLKIDIVPGKYSWTLISTGCGGYFVDSGNLTVKNGYYWQWWCEKE